MNFLIYLYGLIPGLKPDTIILLLTALILALYTEVTYRLWKESKIQTDLLQTPFLVLRFDTWILRDGREHKDPSFHIKNVGKSIATKIMIEGYSLLTTDIKKKFEIKFSCVELLEPNEEKEVKYTVFENGREVNSGGLAVYFFPIVPSPPSRSLDATNSKKISFRTTYKNIFGQKFYCDVWVDASEYRIKNFGKYTRFQKYRRNIFLKLQTTWITIKVWCKRKITRHRGKWLGP